MPLALAPVPDAPRGGSRSEVLDHVDALYNLARYLTRNPADAEDLVQETYARALKAWHQFTAGTELRAWLMRILRNAWLDRHRREGRRLERSGSLDAADPEPQAGGEDTWLRGDFELEQMRRLVAGEIEEALMALSEDQRTAILLDVEGFSEAEAALVLGCAPGTVKSRLSRARAALREKLADYRREEDR